ncbi:uncharacterized protein EV154DRAFT_139675 [Mucor mucedo]|uniref:uncharacterized protein n=1 Tax=Mucor mucedo TaxID=29922 RepID=UPI00221FCB30|nr:uncharacterized protein EV154DRAFT_139675 [Mucor mucedo]KAI7893685.1 hypothetical protein EV154DRAFT_139675 [Mucor mucedo]
MLPFGSISLSLSLWLLSNTQKAKKLLICHTLAPNSFPHGVYSSLGFFQPQLQNYSKGQYVFYFFIILRNCSFLYFLVVALLSLFVSGRSIFSLSLSVSIFVSVLVFLKEKKKLHSFMHP